VTSIYRKDCRPCLDLLILVITLIGIPVTVFWDYMSVVYGCMPGACDLHCLKNP